MFQDTKGQLISKGLLIFLILPKNERKVSAPVAKAKIKTLKFVFGRIQDTRITFRDQLTFIRSRPSIRDGVLRSGMLLYLHHIKFKIFFHPAKFDNFKDEKISDFKTVSVSQRKNLLD